VLIPADSSPIPVDSGRFLQEWEGHCKVLTNTLGIDELEEAHLLILTPLIICIKLRRTFGSYGTTSLHVYGAM
jgi:hypothetical protein